MLVIWGVEWPSWKTHGVDDVDDDEARDVFGRPVRLGRREGVAHQVLNGGVGSGVAVEDRGDVIAFAGLGRVFLYRVCGAISR
jgi:hypothetical protein